MRLIGLTLSAITRFSLSFQNEIKKNWPPSMNALDKAKNGEYGICEECGERIGRGRLKVISLAKFCIACQEIVEKRNGYAQDGYG